MKLNLPSLLLVTFLIQLPFQSTAQIWTKIYSYTSGQRLDQGRSVVETGDGALMVAGGYFGNLVKVDQNGDVLWRKSFDEIDQAIDLALVPDGGVCLIGVNTESGQAWLVKTDASGDKQWAKQLVGIIGVPELSLISNTDGGFTILTGSVNTKSNFIITDQTGAILHNIDLETNSLRFTQLMSSRYVVVNGNSIVLLLTPNGDVIWERELPGARSVAATFDGSFIITGYEEADGHFFLEKWDPDGNRLWREDYPQIEARPFQYLWNKVVVNSAGEISFIGFTDGTSAFIAKTDAEGNLICARNQQLENLSVILMNMAATSDKGFAIVGTKGTPQFDEDLFLMKTDSLCKTDNLEIIYNVDGEVDTVYAEKFSFKYSPNPCSNLVTFEIQPTKAFDGNLTLVFYNMVGRVVRTEKVENGILPVDMSDLPGGMYVFTFVENGDDLGKGKIIIQR